MICRNSCGYYLSSIKIIKKTFITDLALHYDSKGIALSHNIPGSGKTHYIRYPIQDKTLIYIPPYIAK
ncbi:hypothetical protein I4U23_010998 [Adineta vaga]|nr:hypothetical protein I4U23_010998 [Adineta vaga]